MKNSKIVNAGLTFFGVFMLFALSLSARDGELMPMIYSFLPLLVGTGTLFLYVQYVLPWLYRSPALTKETTPWANVLRVVEYLNRLVIAVSILLIFPPLDFFVQVLFGSILETVGWSFPSYLIQTIAFVLLLLFGIIANILSAPRTRLSKVWLTLYIVFFYFSVYPFFVNGSSL